MSSTTVVQSTWDVKKTAEWAKSLVADIHKETVFNAFMENNLNGETFIDSIKVVKDLRDLSIPAVPAGHIFKAFFAARSSQIIENLNKFDREEKETTDYEFECSVTEGKQTKRLQFKKTMTVSQVREKIALTMGISGDNFTLRGRNQVLSASTETLQQVGIVDSTTFAVIVKNNGGAQADGEEEQRIRCLNVRKYPGIKLTKERDVVSFEDDNLSLRAEMSCGHAIGANSMFEYIKWRLGRDLVTTTICCPVPKCSKEWDWNLVAKVADLSLSENLRYQQTIADRLMKRTGIKKCPGCHALGMASESLNIFRAACSSCSVHYCWACEKQWKTDGLQICGNTNCPVLDIQKVLDSCKEKTTTYGSVKIPEIRACPRCLTFAEHTGGCKFMKCKGCNYFFCMSCLTVEKVENTEGFTCSQPGEQCKIAPVQQLK